MKLILIPLFILFLTTCSGTGMKFLHHTDKEIINLSKVKINYPNTKFIVISDLHLYDTNLGISGSAFQNYLDDDRKLLVESEEILQQAINEISKLDFDFIIIPGDLTKDGEKESHIKLSNILRKFLNNNKKVFVVPGNHDINNPESLMYQEDKKIPVPGITPKEFSEIYSDFGYKHAIYRDDDSLSYVVEPIDGLWLLALDPCLYKQNTNKTHPVTEGEFSESTLKWIEDILIKSKREKKAVIAFMHHGITPHYPANLKYYPEYVLNNYEIICELFSSYNVKLTFTGHYHAQDITKVE